MDEKALIAAAVKGDLEAFNRLVLAYQDLAFNVAYRILVDPYLAEDATQTAFISAYRNLKNYRGGSFRAWILRIVTNACYDELRRQKRRPTTPLEPLTQDGEEYDSPRWIADPGELPEDSAARSELEQAIIQCIDALTEDFRAVIVLIDIQGLNYTEAAGVLDRPVGTIKSRISRARVRVQECLQQYKELLPDAFRLEPE